MQAEIKRFPALSKLTVYYNLGSDSERISSHSDFVMRVSLHSSRASNMSQFFSF